ncbi:MAG: bifunctional 4-hydroxy-2-oxoglutarate aldolase/2-dehydro-3-deoxy-phosphogluconate aldolase [Pseudomonadota bacterium]
MYSDHQSHHQNDLEYWLRRAKVVPVLTLDDEADAAPIADALISGGIHLIEVTLRTAAGLPAIKRLRREFPELVLGAGTVRSIEDYHGALDAGADFVVSPGSSRTLLQYGMTASIPLLPGIATPTELMTGLEFGFRGFKFFPAMASGGRPMVRSLLGPFADAWLVPTGGIGGEDVAGWLKEPNVAAVGGTWMVPEERIAARDWPGLEQLAADTVRAVS